MAISQQKFREIVFQTVYSMDISANGEDSIVEMMMEAAAATKKNCREAFLRANQVMDKKELLDERIAKQATSYDFDRIHTVERNILRLSLYELLYDDAIPHKVAIAEAIRLAKKFSSPEAASFINALLDGIYRQNSPEKNDEQ